MRPPLRAKRRHGAKKKKTKTKTKTKKGASRRTPNKRSGKKSRGGGAGSSGAPQSAFRGVSWSPTAKKWQARLSIGQGRRKHVGFFRDDKKAAAALVAAAVAWSP